MKRTQIIVQLEPDIHSYIVSHKIGARREALPAVTLTFFLVSQ